MARLHTGVSRQMLVSASCFSTKLEPLELATPGAYFFVDAKDLGVVYWA